MATGGGGVRGECEDRPPRKDDAFALRSDAYLDRALGLAWYILGDTHEAEDATQEAMARAWKARRSLRQLGSFRRLDRPDPRETRAGSGSVASGWCARWPSRRMPSPRQSIVSAPCSARDSVGRALGSLSLDQRTVVVLRYWRDLSLEQIEERLGWPLGTVKSRLHYAHAVLRERLERDEREVQR